MSIFAFLKWVRINLNYTRQLHLVLWVGLFFAFVPSAVADAPVADDDNRIMEPIGFTDVVDSFDVDDPFDMNIQLRYALRAATGTIYREVANPDDISIPYKRIAMSSYTHLTHELGLGLETGLYRDLMFFIYLPYILSDMRELKKAGEADVDYIVVPGNDPSQDVTLFSLRHSAARRSGIPNINFGIAWAITNQYRTPYLPNWVVRLEGRLSPGNILKPSCDPKIGELDCYNDAGISRGYHALRLETRSSYRYTFLEPYMGAGVQINWAGIAGYYFLPKIGDQNVRLDADQVVNSGPPNEWELVMGLAVIPWESKKDYQRFTADLKIRAVYISEGRDYSPLFDVLGTSNANVLAGNQAAFVSDSGEAMDAPFFGLTDVQEHGVIGMGINLSMQATQYLQFGLKTDIHYVTSHLITGAQKCDPDINDEGDPNVAPFCPDGGGFNRNYRQAIDQPGQRFGITDNLTIHVTADVIGSY